MNYHRAGELLLKPIKELPKGATLSKEVQSEIVAHSETGHHHILETLDMSKMKFYTAKDDTYVEIPSMAKLWHKKSGADVHKEQQVQPAFYKVIIKKEFNYFSKMLERVRD